MDNVVLRSLAKSDGTFLGVPGGEYLCLGNIDSVSQARFMYSVILNAIKDGGISVTKVVGLRFKTDKQFITAGITKENFADVSSAFAKLHIAGWDDTMSKRVSLYLDADSVGGDGVVTTDNVYFVSADELSRTVRLEGVHFIEKGTKLFTLATPDEKTKQRFSLSLVVMNASGMWTIKQIVRSLCVFNGLDEAKQINDEYRKHIFLDTIFTLGGCMRVMPVNIAQYDALKSYNDICHYKDGKLYIPVMYRNGFSYELLKEMVDSALNESGVYRFSKRLAGMLKKGEQNAEN